MEREIRNFQPNESIQIKHREFYFLEREDRPGKTHFSDGGQATVAKMRGEDDNIYALKVFKPRFRNDVILERGNFLRKFANLPGMQAANNEIVDPSSSEYEQDVARHSFLQYATLMPWVPSKSGTMWSALRSKQSLSRYPLPNKTKSLKRAKNLAKVINGLSTKSIAHCDLCPNNLAVDVDDKIYLVDLENFYHDTFSPPPWGCPGGQLGYRHKTVDSLKNKQYSLFADAFAGALLISEMLIWHDSRVRNISLDGSLFEQSELQAQSDKYQVVKRVLREISKECATLFETAWFSEKLDECPPATEWLSALEGITFTEAEILTGATNVHTVSRRKAGQFTASPTKNITKESPTQPISAISPHVSRRLTAAQMQNQRHKQTVSQPAKPVSQQSSQKPIIQTTSNTQSSSVGGLLAGLSAGTVFIIMMICVILVFVWLAYQ